MLLFAWASVALGQEANGTPQISAGQVVIQVVGVLATWVFAFVGTFVILKIVDITVGLRISSEEEVLGLDLSQHNERAYTEIEVRMRTSHG